MPHQWLIWKGLLDMGAVDKAFQIAQTALTVWKQETDLSYNCYEHFIIPTRRGAGNHQFGGLSAPVMAWFTALYVPGTVTGGFDVWVLGKQETHLGQGLETTLQWSSAAHHRPTVLLCLNAQISYQFFLNEKPIASRKLTDGLFAIDLPVAEGRGILKAVPH